MPRALRLVAILFLASSGCDRTVAGQVSLPNEEWIPFEIVDRHPHDTTAFTQGLVYEQGVLFESTGRRGRSVVRKTDLASGQVVAEVSLADHLFGEVIAVLGDRVYQLTWQSEEGFVYAAHSLRLIATFRYPGEGWGLTDDGNHLIMSDGSSILRFLDPDTFREVRRIEVRDRDGAVDQLNELEYVDGQILANVWHRDQIVRISPETGRVTGKLDLSRLVSEVPRDDPEAVLNGIAFDPDGRRLFVTGKLWPVIYEIRLSGEAR
jgi:glutamine cyclotransferase